MISVIVPVYNTEKYLDRCIQSILAQTYTDFELLLINDGSTDSSGAICNKYAEQDSRVRVFHKENGGVSSARNMGLDNAKGEWITFCDSDDWVYESWLQNFAENCNDVDLVCQGIYPNGFLEYKNNHIRFAFDYRGAINEGLLLLYEYSVIGYTVIKCFKRSIVEKYSLRFNTLFSLREDEEFVLRYLSVAKTMVSVDKIGYYYYIPDWDAKYTKVYNTYSLTKSLFRSCCKIYNDDISVVLNQYLYDFTVCFDYTFCNLSFVEKRRLLLNYRETIGAKILKTKLFSLSKWIILLDITGYFSTIFFIIHKYLKLQ